MSWTARITKAPDGELRLQFSEPLRHIDMDRATARHLAALLVVAAGEFECASPGDHQKGVLDTPAAKNRGKRVITKSPLDPAEHDLDVLRQAAKQRRKANG
jgi:hypothetical protein